MNPVSLSELELVARAATPGVWEAVKGAPGGHPDVWEIASNLGDLEYEVIGWVSTRRFSTLTRFDDAVIEANAAYIAAANPETILKLIAVAKAAKDAYDFEKNNGFVARLNPLKEALAGLDGGGQ